MKQSSYLTLWATACGTSMMALGIWSFAMAYAGKTSLAIPLGIAAVFAWVAMRVQLHDRKIALIREDWRRADAARPTADILYENITRPAGTGTDATRDAG